MKNRTLLIFLLIISNLFSVYQKVGELITVGMHQDIEINNDIALVTVNGFGLRIYNVEEPNSPILIGSLFLPESVHDIIIKDELAYLLCFESRLYIVDINDPANPHLLGEYSTSSYTFNHFGINDSYALIFEPLASFNRLEIIDISDSVNPLFVSSHNMPTHFTGCAVTDTVAYVTSLQGLRVYDFSDPYNLIQIDIFESSNTYAPPLVKDNLLYFDSYSGMQIHDISDPNNIQQVGVNADVRFFDCKIEGDRLYAVNRYVTNVVDISDPQETEIIASYCSERSSSKIEITNGIVFCSDYFDKFNIIDTSEPQNHLLINCLDIGATNIAKSPNEELMLTYGWHNEGLKIFKMDEPTEPELVFSHNISSGSSIYIENNFALTVASQLETATLITYDLTNYEDINISGYLPLDYSSIRSIARKNDIIYLGASTDGIIIVDISDIENPQLLNYYEINGFIIDLVIRGDYLYFTSIGGLRIFDISNSLIPIEVGYWDSNNRAESFVLYEDYAYVVDYDGGIKIIDISDPTNPTLISSFMLNDTSLLTVQPIIRNDKLIISDPSWNEIFVFGLSNPTNPNFISSYRWNKYSVDIELIDNCLYCANGFNFYSFEAYGLSILNFNGFLIGNSSVVDLQEPELNLCNFPNPFNPETYINFTLNKNSVETDLTIYNIKGQKVKNITNKRLRAGNHSFIWNGTDFNNNSVASGIYLIKLEVNNQTKELKKCLLLK